MRQSLRTGWHCLVHGSSCLLNPLPCLQALWSMCGAHHKSSWKPQSLIPFLPVLHTAPDTSQIWSMSSIDPSCQTETVRTQCQSPAHHSPHRTLHLQAYTYFLLKAWCRSMRIYLQAVNQDKSQSSWCRLIFLPTAPPIFQFPAQRAQRWSSQIQPEDQQHPCYLSIPLDCRPLPLSSLSLRLPSPRYCRYHRNLRMLSKKIP